MFRPVLLLTLAAVMAAGTAVADVYKYKDEKGNIQYTDKPPSLPAERLNVQSQRTDVVAAQERSQAAVQSANSKPTGNSTPEQKAAAETTAKDKADRCIKARERYDRYMNSPKLYEQGKDGERRYLTDAELDAARASAKASMDVMCQ
ncbi:DUF4124 domain-containing protein [Steroidobacter flavus]|uniref:DUF4124 domain-containing protein n=1 Tax=Steroidobacter flavus TaxID=1842136 RepID=A0ABV8STY6_9GAMM